MTGYRPKFSFWQAYYWVVIIVDLVWAFLLGLTGRTR